MGHDVGFERIPLCGGGHGDAGGVEKLLHLGGFRREVRGREPIKIGPGGVFGILEATKRLPPLSRKLVRSTQALVEHGRKVGVGEVQRIFGTVVDAFPPQVAVQIHLAQANGVGMLVALADGWHRMDAGLFGHGRQPANGGFHGFGEVGGIHGHGDIERAQVAGDVLPHLVVGEIVVVGAGRIHLQNFRTQIRHVDATGDGVGAVHYVFEHDVGVAGFELDLGEGLEEHPGIDLFLADSGVFHHFLVVLGDGNVGKCLAVYPLHIVGTKQVHVGIIAG